MLAITAVGLGRIFQNLQPHRGMTGDEIVIVERMNEGSFGAGKGARVERAPGDVVGDEDEFGPERAHPFQLRGRRGLDRDHGAGHARFARGVGDPLPGVAGADRPDAARAFRFGQERDRVGRSAQFVGIDRLQVFELQPDVGKVRAELEPNERGAEDGGRDPLARGANFGELNRTDRRRSGGHLSGVRMPVVRALVNVVARSRCCRRPSRGSRRGRAHPRSPRSRPRRLSPVARFGRCWWSARRSRPSPRSRRWWN